MSENQKKKTYFLDELSRRPKKALVLDFPLYRYVKKYKNKALHLSTEGANRDFYTEDSRLYFSPLEYQKIKKGERVVRIARRLDGVHSRDFTKTKIHPIGKSDVAFLKARRKYASFRSRCLETFENSTQFVSPVKMWNLSLVGAMIFGMLTMTMIYRYLGGSVSAKIQEGQFNAQTQVAVEMPVEDFNNDIDPKFITQLLRDYQANEEIGAKQREMEAEIMEMVKGYPIEQMVPEIAKRDRMIAALLVAIARKESSWGKHVPVLNGEDCYNYWGYRGIRKRMGTGGHTCFDSPKDAVDTVAKRIETLVNKEKLNTAAKMVVWKCGYDCSWDNKAAVQKWISDVDYYYQKLNK